MEASRMYQYGLMYDMLDDAFAPLAENLSIEENSSHVHERLSRTNRPNAMSSILSMIGDYGFNMERMELVGEDQEANTVTFELWILGDLNETHMKKLIFQLSKESDGFVILECY